jgi:hypothetical protein
VESNWVHSALRPPIDILYQPRVIMMIEKLVEWLAREPKYSEKTCPSAALSTTNPTCCPDTNPGRRGGEPATNRLSYGTASCFLITDCMHPFPHTSSWRSAYLIKHRKIIFLICLLFLSYSPVRFFNFSCLLFFSSWELCILFPRLLLWKYVSWFLVHVDRVLVSNAHIPPSY